MSWSPTSVYSTVYSTIYSTIYSNRIWHEPIIEVRKPKPGFRHQSKERLVWHRFPVKGGISPREAMLRDEANPLKIFGILFERNEIADTL